jgi:integrase/recombinase XerC
MQSNRATTLSEESIDRFHSWCSARGKSENTTKAYRSDLKGFLLAVGEFSIPMEEFEELAMSWLNMTRAKSAPKTTQRRLTSLKQFGRWAGLVEPLDDYVAPRPAKTKAHPLKEGMDGARRMIRFAKNDQQVAIVALGAMVGCRISETLSLTIHSFDIPDMSVTIRGKGDKTRIVPVSTEAWEYLIPCYSKAMTNQGQRLVTYADRTARGIVSDLAAAADLAAPGRSHDLRATFATSVFDQCKNIRVVQELLGHGQVSTTEIYTSARFEQLRKAVELNG